MSLAGFGNGTGICIPRKITAAEFARRDRRERFRFQVRNFLRQGWREIPLELFIFLLPVLQRLIPGLNTSYGTCYARRFDQATGRWVELGKVGRHLKTTAGKNYIAACFDNTNEPELLKYHAFGTGTTAAAVGDTALQTELTTQYATDNTRPTGSQAHSTNTYTTIATLTPDASVTISEWALMTQAATGGGTCFDRQVFTGVPLNGTGDALQMTYVYTES